MRSTRPSRVSPVLCRLALAPALLALAVTPLRAAEPITLLPDAQAIAQMEQRAAAANPREQCFLYTEIVNALAEVAGHQLLIGDPEAAGATLHRMSDLLTRMHGVLSHDTHRVKNAELLMHRTVFRMSSFLRSASTEDRAVLQAAVRQADAMDNELLAQVFSH